MNKKSLIIALVADIVLIGLTYLIFPYFLGQVAGFIHGFFGSSNFLLPLVLIYVILLYPIWRITKKIIG